jgi:hypothetical protein
MTTKLLLLAATVAGLALSACTDSPPADLGADQVLLFENTAAPDEAPQLEMGVRSEICMSYWNSDGQPGYNLDGSTVTSSNPEIATFAREPSPVAPATQCVYATPVAPGVTTLAIYWDGDSEVDQIAIPVLPAQ